MKITVEILSIIVGLANSGKVKKNNKKWPVVVIILGVIIMIPSVVVTVIVAGSVASCSYNQEHMLERYDSVPECWMNEQVHDKQAGFYNEIYRSVNRVSN